uniref:Uncharacterized protein n=1 Tax=Setaria italica TaxID=4555 RepID=K3YYW5_SETIT
MDPSVMVHDGLALPAASSRGKRGFTFRVIMCLDLVEDPTDRDSRSNVHNYKWHYGAINGERVPRDRHDPLPRDHHDKHRHDDTTTAATRRAPRTSWTQGGKLELPPVPKPLACSQGAGTGALRIEKGPSPGQELCSRRTSAPARGHERHQHRRTERRARLEPRPHPQPLEASLEVRPHCNPATPLNGNDDDHLSPQPPTQKQQAAPRKTKKKLGLPTRKSLRGDSLSRARQVLMKQLGVTQEEGQSSKEALLRYINLFKGPLSDLVMKALAVLSDLNGSTAMQRAAV